MGLILLGQTNKEILAGKRQRQLRNAMTDAEQALWKTLRGRQICGVKFRRQHPFEDYILDFVCLEIKLVMEVDGGQHQMNKNYDALRTQYLRLAGFDVLRFWNHDVLQNLDAVKEEIFRVVEEKIKGRGEGNPSPPRPSP